MDVVALHRRACAEFDARVRRIGPTQWSDPTPCSDWDVRALVNHIVYENLWTAPLLEGKTVAEVGDRFEGDVLGEEPVASWERAVSEAGAAVAGTPMERTVHLSFGDFPADFYVAQLFADHLIHAWDLAKAIGDDDALDAELVAACAQWYAGMEQAYRESGAVAERPDAAGERDPQTELLAAFGRNRRWAPS